MFWLVLLLTVIHSNKSMINGRLVSIPLNTYGKCTHTHIKIINELSLGYFSTQYSMFIQQMAIQDEFQCIDTAKLKFTVFICRESSRSLNLNCFETLRYWHFWWIGSNVKTWTVCNNFWGAQAITAFLMSLLR